MNRFLSIPLLVLVGACAEHEPQTAGTPERAPQDELVLPEYESVDFVSAFTDALTTLLDVNTSKPWAGHKASLGYRQAGCPDIYAGAPEDADIDAEPGEGMSWSDYCDTDAGLSFGGYNFWESSAVGTGLITDPSGRVTTGERRLDQLDEIVEGLVAQKGIKTAVIP